MRAALVVRDLMPRSRLHEAAVAAGYEVAAMREGPAVTLEGAPDLLVVDLDLAGALQGAAAWRAAHPGTRGGGLALPGGGGVIAEARAAGGRGVAQGAAAR